MPEWVLPYFLGCLFGAVVGSIVATIGTHRTWVKEFERHKERTRRMINGAPCE